MTKRELLAGAAAVLPQVEPQQAASHNALQTKSPVPRDNARAKRRNVSPSKRNDGGDGDDDDDGDGPLRPGIDFKPDRHPAPKPIPADALWLTSNQVLARYGGRSAMWLWRKVKNDPAFPKPRYAGRMQLYSVPELNAYDAALILKRA
jgi:hypothetical protein